MLRLDVIWERIADWFIVTMADPGKLRLYSAIKSFLAVAFSLLVLAALALVLKLALIGVLFGLAVTQQGVMLIGKQTRPAELWRLALVLMFAGAVSVVSAMLLAGDRVLSQVGFILMLVVATYVRRFGTRGLLTCLTIFGAYLNFAVLALLSSRFLPPIAQWPWFVCCVVVCIGCGWDAGWMDHQGPSQTECAPSALSFSLEFTKMACKGRPISAVSDWQPCCMFNARSRPISNSQPAKAVSSPARTKGAPEHHTWSRAQHSFWQRLDTMARQACQILIATVLAVVLGNLLSMQREYWAILGAYIAIAGTHSRQKGLYCVIGTLLGVLISTLVVSFVAGNLIILVGLNVFCLFMVIYWGPVNYSMKFFFVTTMVVLLYGLLGELSIQLLTLRREETVVGVSLGALVVLCILPISTNCTL